MRYARLRHSIGGVQPKNHPDTGDRLAGYLTESGYLSVALRYQPSQRAVSAVLEVRSEPGVPVLHDAVLEPRVLSPNSGQQVVVDAELLSNPRAHRETVSALNRRGPAVGAT